MAVKAVVLAAGAGTRMKSDLPKVLNTVAGRPMIAWVLDAIRPIEPEQIVVVVGQGGDLVRDAISDDVDVVIQEEQLGTGHATGVALSAISAGDADSILVTPGDTPLLVPETLAELIRTHRRTGSAVSVLTADIDAPAGYGRILRDGWDRVVGIVEHGDASPSQRGINEINGGVYVFNGSLLADALPRVEPNNVQGEYYLTDVIEILAEEGHPLHALKTNPVEIAGVNSHIQLAQAAGLMRRRINEYWMRRGVWMQDPDRVYLEADVQLEPGAILLPDTHLRGSTTVAAGARVGPNVTAEDSSIGPDAHVWYSVLRGAEVGEGVEVGPYASLRPETVLRKGSKVGTFVETKKTTVGEGSKVPHLSYIGDTEIGKGANIGAGTITCNYDGIDKHATVIGDRAFIGSDTMLVAPVTIGEDAVTGAGSTITKDVAPGALAVERSVQKEIPDYAARRKRKGS
ncbi:MAG: UDP-N-acetylglucosamine diphosphorylase/glucosamine-1-phosphate N-acetyltransferase [Gammaproteobacteria bacterium]|nr:UDP-N-acetylglucosamine diphosphorylase/glucosamine-1-phosphate N-acetyltransferase [Gammaproteobacteria bacterium]